MRTGTFYLSHDATSGATAVPLPKGGYVFVRVTESRNDMCDALDKAKPRKGEMVMNTHPLPPRQK